MAKCDLGSRLIIIVGVIAAILFWGMPGRSLAQEKEVISAGQLEYQQYCVSCHGAEGRGNGPTASILTVKPADLTQLSKTHGGQFPFWQMYLIIDGRAPTPIKGHGTPEMPVWGKQFQMEESGAAGSAQTRGKILQLVYYLQSIQEK